MDYDAILLISFGGPEKMEDIHPFIDHVLEGKNVPDERKKEVAHHYELFDGVSPINEQNRQLINALKEELKTHNINLPIYWGNRNWHPFLTDTMKAMTDDSITTVIAFVTSAFSCYSSCRQYLEDIERARTSVGPTAPAVDKIRPFYNHPGFIESNAEHIKSAFSRLTDVRKDSIWIIFTAHSIPNTMAENSDYAKQLLESCKLTASALQHPHWSLAYQSRSGSPQTPWLGPDICDHLIEIKEKKFTNIIIAPIGFVSDHMEVIFDLDTEAADFCAVNGIRMERAMTASIHPKFVSMVRELISERLFDNQEPRYLGTMGPAPNDCGTNCCLMK